MANQKKIDPEILKNLSISRTESALQRGTFPLSKEHINDNLSSLPAGVRESISIKNEIKKVLNKGFEDNSIKSVRSKHAIDGKALDRRKAVELREARKHIFDLNRSHKKS